MGLIPGLGELLLQTKTVYMQTEKSIVHGLYMVIYFPGHQIPFDK